jgi:polyribonucleotide nucleotidyltransferase
MTLQAITKSFDIGNGQAITLETGKIARQADGSILLRTGKCAILATVVSAKEAKPGMDFLPLTVEYQEKFAAAGRIPGSFFRREGRIGDPEILVSRLIDRAIRPLFPDGYRCETQVLISMISADEEVMPDSLAGLAASAALTISDIPFDGPISEVRVIKSGDKYIVNPLVSQIKGAKLDILIGATLRDILMVEGEAQECSEDELIEAIKVGHEAIKIQCKAQLELAELVGLKPKREAAIVEEDEELKSKVADFCKDKIYAVAIAALPKPERKEGFKKIKADFLATIPEEELETFDTAKFEKYFSKLEKDVVRNMVLDNGVRLDGRKPDEIRPLFMEVDYLPSPHGSALFTRGETQSLTTVTMGSKQDEQMVDKVMGMEFSKFMLHYNFPPFCTGEVKPLRGTSRREVGHGFLAMRSLKQMLPDETSNPYTIRIVSDVLESNGSSSMATVCAGSLALFDAGVKMKKHVSGIAMGMIAREDGKFAVLSDILGDEDHLGDMDFKLTGTRDGICGCQMDIKVDGLSYEVLLQAIKQASHGRLHILSAMEECMAAPRQDYKPHTPRIEMIEIPQEFIGAIIGPGGKVIQEMQAQTNTEISIDEDKDRKVGKVSIMGPNLDSIKKALARIKGIVAVPEDGEIYDAEVKSIMPYGAFVEFLPGKQGLVHISEMSWEKLDDLNGVIKEGEIIQVKFLGLDRKSGKYRLSRREALPKE